MGIEEVASILRKIWPYLLVGIGLGAAIHGWAPEDFFAPYAGADNPFAVLIAVAHRRPAVLQRRRHPAAGRGPARQGPADGHPAGVHDGRRRPQPARDDPAAPRPQAPAHRRLRRASPPSGSSPSATCSTPSCNHHQERTPSEHQDPRPRLRQLRQPREGRQQAVAELGIDATFEKVTDYADIAGYGVMRTPGLVVDEQVVLSGRVPTAAPGQGAAGPLGWLNPPAPVAWTGLGPAHRRLESPVVHVEWRPSMPIACRACAAAHPPRFRGRLGRGRRRHHRRGRRGRSTAPSRPDRVGEPGSGPCGRPLLPPATRRCYLPVRQINLRPHSKHSPIPSGFGCCVWWLSRRTRQPAPVTCPRRWAFRNRPSPTTSRSSSIPASCCGSNAAGGPTTGLTRPLSVRSQRLWATARNDSPAVPRRPPGQMLPQLAAPRPRCRNQPRTQTGASPAGSCAKSGRVRNAASAPPGQ